MLDKSMPYYSVIMKKPAETPLIPWRVPTGFGLSFYTRGMERKWASIETAVGEFSEVAEAERYFSIHYFPFQIQLSRRMLFAHAKDGTVAGTITAWWNHTGRRRDPSIHWLAVHPNFQKLGLGRSLISECLSILCDLEGRSDVWLHTQTWSHAAIRLYLEAGFKIVKDEIFAEYTNESGKAIPILKTFIPGLSTERS